MDKKQIKAQRTLVLLDAHAIIHRAYHALPDFQSTRGEPTGALYGLANMLMKIITDLKPDYLAACYDLPEKTFRHEAYENYKAGRAKADDALVAQLVSSQKVFEAFDIPIYSVAGFEADDILGTVVEKYKKEKNTKIIIASGDMDTMQLVEGDKVQVFTLKKGITDTILYDEEKVKERFGFGPELLPDYKGLRGDPSDNIIGIKGVGEKTATTLIAEFGTIEKIYKELKTKKGEERFKKLGLSDRMIELLKMNEEEAMFSKTLATIRRNAPIDFSLPKKTFWETVSPEKIKKAFGELEFRSLLSRLPSFWNGNGKEFPKEQEASQAGLFADEKVDSFELKAASIALWLINSDLPNPTLEDIFAFAQAKTFKEARKFILAKLKEEGLEKVFREIELPIVSAVERMGERGILIDRPYFEKLSREYHLELEKLSLKIHKLAGEEFNINSPKQLSRILFEKLELKNGKRKKASGAYSTNIEVLEELSSVHPIAEEIIKYRELQKLLSTYIDVIPGLAGADGRLHAQFIQNSTTTGRFSSQNPNLQNLPVKSELGKKIRTGFVAEKGHKLLALDYSQIELRVAAILSKDSKLSEIFREKKDVHAGVASFVFGVPLEKVDGEMRRRAKVINFGIIYGMGVSALQKNLGSSREEAQKFFDNYFRQFAGLRDYLEGVKAFASKHGHTLTLFGRRRRFPNINSKIPFLRSMAERTAINAPLQGTAADIIKLAIRFAEEDLRDKKLLSRVHLVLQVHDELVYEVEESVLEEAEKTIKSAMENVLYRSFLRLQTDIPLEAHSGFGKDLGEVK